MTLTLIIWLQALVVQSLDSAMHRINPYPAVNYQGVFLGVAENVVGSLLCFIVGIVQGLFNLQYYVITRHITSYVIVLRHNTRPQHQETTIRQTGCAIHLSPPQKPLCLVGRLGRKKKSARGTMGRGKRELRIFAFSLFPSPPARFPFFFFDYCYFYRDTQREPLWRREVIHSIELYPVDSVIHVLNNWRLNLIQLACRTRQTSVGKFYQRFYFKV